MNKTKFEFDKFYVLTTVISVQDGINKRKFLKMTKLTDFIISNPTTNLSIKSYDTEFKAKLGKINKHFKLWWRKTIIGENIIQYFSMICDGNKVNKMFEQSGSDNLVEELLENRNEEEG